MPLNVAAFTHPENTTFTYFEPSFPYTFAARDGIVHTTPLTKSKGNTIILTPSHKSPAKLAVLNTASTLIVYSAHIYTQATVQLSSATVVKSKP